MFFKIFVLFIVFRGSVSTNARNEQECSFEDDLYKQFATKTAYSMIKGVLSDDDYKVGDCEPVKFWFLSTHGASYPSESIMDGLRELKVVHEKIPTEPTPVCAEDLKDWNLAENYDYDELSLEGSDEMKNLTQRYQIVFNELFRFPENFLCQHAEEIRSQHSYEAFAKAVFEDDFRNVSVTVETEEEDMLLKFYENCDKWKDNNNIQDEPTSESSKFENSAKFNATIENIAHRLGLANLTIEEVNKIWDVCRFEKAWNNSALSPWCLAFAKEDIDVLEYREDLKSYYKTGYGYEINSHLACKTVVDMLEHLGDNKTLPKVIAYFANATTIQLFLTALGVREGDSLLTENNFNSTRKWKSSEISSFASNLAVVKYNCPPEEPIVKFFLNERPLEFDWCEPKDLCKLSEIVEQYRRYTDVDCKNYYCSSKAKIVYGIFYIILGLISIYLY